MNTTQWNVYSIVALCTAIATPNFASAVAASGQGTWETTLQGRDLDGDPSTFEAYYDTVLDITWLADANFAKTTGFDTDGFITWDNANAWAAGLDPYGSGITGWRLPDTDPVNGAAYNSSSAFDGSTDRGWNISAPGTIYAGSTGSEMAHMFYNTLGNLAFFDTSGNSPQPGWGLTNTGPFSNLQPSNLWSATEYAQSSPDEPEFWIFDFGIGFQTTGSPNSFYVWAVRDGDVGAEPTAATDIEIDIKPGNPRNVINPSSKGKIRVAVLTAAGFDASTVDVTSIQFGQSSAAPASYRLDDVDHDGDWDLVLMFNTQDTGIACGDTEATLTGQTFAGVQITGTDSVKTVGCKKIAERCKGNPGVPRWRRSL